PNGLMKSHSSGNANQTKLLDRELRRAEKLADRLDRVLALAERETGFRSQDSGFSETRTPSPESRPPVPGVWAQAYGASAPLQTAPVVPVPAPTPGDRPLARARCRSASLRPRSGSAAPRSPPASCTTSANITPSSRAAAPFPLTKECAAATRRSGPRSPPASCPSSRPSGRSWRKTRPPILSEAKDLLSEIQRFFASLRMTSEGLRMTA